MKDLDGRIIAARTLVFARRRGKRPANENPYRIFQLKKKRRPLEALDAMPKDDSKEYAAEWVRRHPAGLEGNRF